jgi:methylmalonyl-CoA mutase cobalamin-binding subunit
VAENAGDEMTAEVVKFTGITTLDLPPDQVLRAALDAGMTEVVISGYDADGNNYYSGSMSDAMRAHWHLARAQHRLMCLCDDLEDAE